MFTERDLSEPLAVVRERSAPDALVLDCDRDFETLDPAVAEDLLLVTDSVDPLSYPAEWVPDDAPAQLHTLASSDFTIGVPEDGGVAWTRQTDPPVVLVKPRLNSLTDEALRSADGTASGRDSQDSFVDFLIAEALVQVGLGLPEHFLGFFGERYPDFAAAVHDHIDSAGTYQLAAAVFDASVGRQTRPTFADWDGPLCDAWVDAGERLEPRLADLPREVALGQTDFAAAAELACSAVKHGLDVPAPFAALDTSAYDEYGADYAITWAQKTLDELD